MKMLCLVLFVMAVGLCHSWVPASDACISKNPFLKDMASSTPLHVEIFDSPSKVDIQHCKSEWKAHGTCCNQEDLSSIFKLESMLIESNEASLTKAVKEIRKSIEQTTDILVAHPSKSDKSAEIRANLKKYVTLSAFANFKKESQKCWSYMKKARASALCTICSGRSEHYFDNGKIIVPQDMCQSAIENCELFFIKLSIIIKKFPLIIENYKKIKGSSEEIEDYEILQKELEAYCPTQELLDAFAEYEEYKQNKATSAIHSAKVCSMILNIRKTPYIMLMNPEHIETVAQATQDQIARRFKELEQHMTIDDNKARDAFRAEMNQNIDKENQYHQNQEHVIKRTYPEKMRQEYEEWTNVYVKSKTNRRTKKVICKKFKRERTKKYRDVPNPTRKQKLDAESARHNKAVEAASNNFKKKEHDLMLEAEKRKKELEKNHKHAVLKVVDEKKKNLDNWEKAQAAKKASRESKKARKAAEKTSEKSKDSGKKSEEKKSSKEEEGKKDEKARKLRIDKGKHRKIRSDHIDFNPIFTSDSVVSISRQGDNLQTHDGMQGTSLDNENRNLRPMNFSNCFP